MKPDEFLESYIKKVLEIQHSKDNSLLSKEDYDSIAMNMGISEADLREAQNAHLTRGQGYLKYANWGDALKEFQQLLILNPNDAAVYFHIALAYSGLYKNEGKNKYKEQAIQYAEACIQLKPDFEQAFRLISTLKGSIEDKYDEGRKDSILEPNKSILVYLISFLLFFALLIGGVLYFIFLPGKINDMKNNPVAQAYKEKLTNGGALSYFNESGVNINSSLLLNGAKGPVLWVSSYKQTVDKEIERAFTLHLIDPVEQKILKEIPLTIEKGSNITRMHWYYLFTSNDLVYTIEEQGEGSVEARNMYTGEIVLDNGRLASQFKELKQGVASVKKNNDPTLLKITTKKGDIYYYNINTQKLMTEEALEKSNQSKDNHKQKWAIYEWYMIKEGLKANIALIQKESNYSPNPSQLHPSYFTEEVRNGFERYIDLQKNNYSKLMFYNKEKVYLDPIIFYADSNLCVFRHVEELGNQGSTLWTCLDNTGKVVWENTLNEEDKLLLGFDKNSKSNYTVNRYKNNLMISCRSLKLEESYYLFTGMMDLKTGKMTWEFSPQY